MRSVEVSQDWLKRRAKRRRGQEKRWAQMAGPVTVTKMEEVTMSTSRTREEDEALDQITDPVYGYMVTLNDDVVPRIIEPLGIDLGYSAHDRGASRPRG